ncbi:hypothetical protein T069G_08490 [Trichoderma breve]|uniref:Uncharacterized protein n=1 Tax=Trichoderma breve TaxID=2034170 RepID=A0A9W9BCV5_9HYPO|nr:hypothetical protein T069G_08490 [Trichoderma breve]KAJ4857593.1 hypothetical protein T069G_08490 [Trichoderma breve]
MAYLKWLPTIVKRDNAPSVFPYPVIMTTGKEKSKWMSELKEELVPDSHSDGKYICTKYVGFILGLPLGKEQIGNEQQDFEVGHQVDESLGGGAVLPSDQAEIYIKFPREGCSYTFEEASKAVLDRFSNAKGRERGVTVIRVSLADEVCVTVSGFRMPFANADDAQVEGWVNQNEPIINNLILLDVITRKTFYVVVSLPVEVARNKFAVDKIPPPFKTHTARSKSKDLIKANKGYQFETAFSHPDDNHHMTAVWYGMTTSAKVKDNMELHRALVRGDGFYDWMVKKPLDSIVDAMSSLSVANTAATCRPLPVVNFLDWNRYSHGRSLTCVQFATIFKRNKVKKGKEPNHVTSTLARYLKSTYLEQARVWKSDRRREFHKVAKTMTYAIGPSAYTFGSNRIAKNAAKKGVNWVDLRFLRIMFGPKICSRRSCPK